MLFLALQLFVEFSSNTICGIDIVRTMIPVHSTDFILRLTLLGPSLFVDVLELLDCNKCISNKSYSNP
jgi:hypothetical protein